MRRGFTAGAFDLCHAGHVAMFREARRNCDFLVVALQTDPSIDRPEKHKPIMSVEERIEILRGIKYIDQIFVYDTEADLLQILKAVRPDIRFLGEDWKGKDYTGRELGISVYWNGRSHGFSTSELRKRVYDEERKEREDTPQ